MTSKHQRNGSRLAAVAVMISLWVALWALEVSPDLHRLLHEDAQSPGHTCLVTQFQHHLLLSGFVAAATPRAARCFERPAWLRRFSVSSLLTITG